MQYFVCNWTNTELCQIGKCSFRKPRCYGLLVCELWCSALILLWVACGGSYNFRLHSSYYKIYDTKQTKCKTSNYENMTAQSQHEKTLCLQRQPYWFNWHSWHSFEQAAATIISVHPVLNCWWYWQRGNTHIDSQWPGYCWTSLMEAALFQVIRKHTVKPII